MGDEGIPAEERKYVKEIVKRLKKESLEDIIVKSTLIIIAISFIIMIPNPSIFFIFFILVLYYVVKRLSNKKKYYVVKPNKKKDTEKEIPNKVKLTEYKTILSGFILIVGIIILLVFYFEEQFVIFSHNLGNLYGFGNLLSTIDKSYFPEANSEIISFILSSIIQSFSAILALLAAAYVFYTGLYRNDSKAVRDLYVELRENIIDSWSFEIFNGKYHGSFDPGDYKKLKIHFDENPKIKKIDVICEHFKKMIGYREKSGEEIDEFSFKIGNENLEAMIRNVFKRGALRGRKFNYIMFFLITSIFGGIGLFLMLNKITWLFVSFGIIYLIWISASFLMLLTYLNRLSNI